MVGADTDDQAKSFFVGRARGKTTGSPSSTRNRGTCRSSNTRSQSSALRVRLLEKQRASAFQCLISMVGCSKSEDERVQALAMWKLHLAEDAARWEAHDVTGTEEHAAVPLSAGGAMTLPTQQQAEAATPQDAAVTAGQLEDEVLELEADAAVAADAPGAAARRCFSSTAARIEAETLLESATLLQESADSSPWSPEWHQIVRATHERCAREFNRASAFLRVQQGQAGKIQQKPNKQQ